MTIRTIKNSVYIIIFGLSFLTTSNSFGADSQKQQKTAKAVVVLIDSSFSMGKQDTLSKAKQVGLRVIFSLNDKDEIMLAFFDNTYGALTLLSSAERVKSIARERIKHVKPLSEANYPVALGSAKKHLSKSKLKNKFIVLISDSQQPKDSSGQIEAEISKEISKLKLQGIALSTIKVGSRYDSAFLEKLSKSGNGVFGSVVNKNETNKTIHRLNEWFKNKP